MWFGDGVVFAPEVATFPHGDAQFAISEALYSLFRPHIKLTPEAQIPGTFPKMAEPNQDSVRAHERVIPQAYCPKHHQGGIYTPQGGNATSRLLSYSTQVEKVMVRERIYVGQCA